MFKPFLTRLSFIHAQAWAVATVALSFQTTLLAGDLDLWTLRPYAVHVVVISDTVSTPSEVVSAAIRRRLEARASAVVGSLWQLRVSVPTGGERDAVRRAIENQDIRELPASSNDAEPAETIDETEPSPAYEPAMGVGYDKLLLLHATESATGYLLQGVEYDLYVRRLGMPQERTVSSGAGVPEQAFRLACDLFSPVAIFSINRDDYRNASLTFRGSELPRRDSSPNWVEAGDVMLPMLRRTNREGNVPVGGVQAAPWTLLEVLDNPEAPTAKVVSHTRRPFGARRRGRVEQVAIFIPLVEDATCLRLHARDNAEQPLEGYHVYARDSEEGELSELGVTDAQGAIAVPRTESKIRTLFVKSGSKLVAKLPIAPGAQRELSAALVDERKRIEAEARLSLLREDLIDLVARRNILISRARAAIEAKDFAKAGKLVSEVEGLPSLNVFNQRLTEQQQLSRARDPQVQARIDKLFENTRTVLGSFLSSREITALRRDYSEAAKQ